MADSEQLPARFDIAIEAGDDYQYDVEVTDEDGNTIDFSQHSGQEIIIWRTENQNRELKRYTEADGGVTTTANGRIPATFPAADTEEWHPKVFYEMKSDDGNGNTRTWVEGEISARR